ncbi:MAG: sigma-70 family RNA polymerase sigma factor [Clostridia bacterium]|nr:sigma-70 family RNA polymerase sigma factor [Clostridia bacterium]
MAKINLKNFYPFYQQDCYIEVSDELAEILMAAERAEEAYKRKLRRNRAFYSLDRGDGIERDICFASQSAEELYEQKLTRDELHAAISTLPDKQAKRIYAHYLLGMSISEIARAEGVSWHSIDKSIREGIANLEKRLKSLH